MTCATACWPRAYREVPAPESLAVAIDLTIGGTVPSLALRGDDLVARPAIDVAHGHPRAPCEGLLEGQRLGHHRAGLRFDEPDEGRTAGPEVGADRHPRLREYQPRLEHFQPQPVAACSAAAMCRRT